jgi:hypothetical protein
MEKKKEREQKIDSNITIEPPRGNPQSVVPAVAEKRVYTGPKVPGAAKPTVNPVKVDLFKELERIWRVSDRISWQFWS